MGITLTNMNITTNIKKEKTCGDNFWGFLGSAAARCLGEAEADGAPGASAFVYVCMYIYIYTCVYACIHMCMYIYIYIYIYIHIHIYIYTYIHIYIYDDN